MIRRVRAHPIGTALGVSLIVLVCVGGAFAWSFWRSLDSAPLETQHVLPTAARLTAQTPDQVVYRIDASRSRVGYEVQERLAGVSRTATGSTRAVAGDVRVDHAEPSSTTIGEIVVDVSRLTSDQRLRDQRLRHDFLESQDHPLAVLRTTSVDGLPDQVTQGVDHPVSWTGDLTVREVTAPVTFEGTARLDGTELTVRATGATLLSKFGIGPIQVMGLVSTSDEVVITVDVVAVDVGAADAPTVLAAPGEPVIRTGDGPSFSRTVQPVLAARCATCHNPGGVGSDIWSLDVAADAAAVADGLALVTRAGFMPPWPASDLSLPFRHSMALTEAELEAIGVWADAGGPLDVDPATPVRPAPSDAPQIQRDLELTMAEPYQGSPAKPNDYRCFELDPGFRAPTFVQGFAFEAEQTEVVHHALAFRVRATSREAITAADGADGRPGWPCFPGVEAREATTGIPGGGGTAPTVQFMAWAPGQAPVVFPAGVGLLMEPGDSIVVQIHYHYEHRSPPDRSRMVLDLAEPGEDLVEVRYDVYLAPAEIPCAVGEVGPLCDRQAVIDLLRATYGFVAAMIPDFLHAACGTRPEDFAWMTSGVAGASCDHRISTFQAGELLGVFGHMHEIGRSFRMTLNPGTDRERVLLDIPVWRFGWQLNYEPAERVELQPGDILRIECTWDRALMSPRTPRHVTWAEGTEDEMCYSTVTTRPVTTRPL